MDTSYLLEQLHSNWQLPNWREAAAIVRKQLGLILLIETVSIGGTAFMRWAGHPFLLLIPQMLIGILLTLIYYRSVIDPEVTMQRSLSGAMALASLAFCNMMLKMVLCLSACFLLVLPGIYVFARLFLVDGIVAADRPGISDHPLKASWKLTEHHSGPLCVLSAMMMIYAVLVMIAGRHLGTALAPRNIIFQALLGLPAFAGWMGYAAICSERAIHAQPEELLANFETRSKPTGWISWFTRLFAGLGIIFVGGIVMGVGFVFLGTTSTGGKAMRAFMRLNPTGGNVVVHGHTVLVPPTPWIANPDENISRSQVVSFHLTALGGVRTPEIHMAWLPISAPFVIDQSTAQRLSGLVVSGMDDLELQKAKVLRGVYDALQRQLAEYRITSLAVLLSPDPQGWMVIRTRGVPSGVETVRDRFMPWDGGLLVFSDRLNYGQNAQTADAQERPLLDALKL